MSSEMEIRNALCKVLNEKAINLETTHVQMPDGRIFHRALAHTYVPEEPIDPLFQPIDPIDLYLTNNNDGTYSCLYSGCIVQAVDVDAHMANPEVRRKMLYMLEVTKNAIPKMGKEKIIER